MFDRREELNLSVTNSPGGSPPCPLLHFDVFLSYSKCDEQWVIDYLSGPLEARGYNVCLLHQDGPQYSNALHYVNNELIGQLKQSQALVINLTKDFLEKEWKALHIRMSHQYFAKENKRVRNQYPYLI